MGAEKIRERAKGSTATVCVSRARDDLSDRQENISKIVFNGRRGLSYLDSIYTDVRTRSKIYTYV